jgi:Lmo2446-like, N-terminal
MQIWHLTPDTPRSPRRVSPGEPVVLMIGTWPTEPGQSVWVSYRQESLQCEVDQARVEASWVFNQGENSYWRAELGSFSKGARLSYTVHGLSTQGGFPGERECRIEQAGKPRYLRPAMGFITQSRQSIAYFSHLQINSSPCTGF